MKTAEEALAQLRLTACTDRQQSSLNLEAFNLLHEEMDRLRARIKELENTKTENEN